MAKRKNIKSTIQYNAALDLERSGDQSGAIKLYQKAAITDPANIHAWNRQMILYRKFKTKEDEVKLIKTAITAYQRSIEMQQQNWLQTNKAKADDTRQLAEALGLLQSNGLPVSDDNTLEKWNTRLYLLEYRIKNARKKRKSAKKANGKQPVVSKTSAASSQAKKKTATELKGSKKQANPKSKSLKKTIVKKVVK